jgi:hypothetical protein
VHRKRTPGQNARIDTIIVQGGTLTGAYGLLWFDKGNKGSPGVPAGDYLAVRGVDPKTNPCNDSCKASADNSLGQSTSSGAAPGAAPESELQLDPWLALPNQVWESLPDSSKTKTLSVVADHFLRDDMQK